MALAVSEVGSLLSLVAQLGAMALAAAVGRFALRSRASIWAVCFLGAGGAMIANILVDGQGAFIMLFYAPVIYFVATVGRTDLDPAPRR